LWRRCDNRRWGRPEPADSYSRIVTFGDSLTDLGNAFVLLESPRCRPSRRSFPTCLMLVAPTITARPNVGLTEAENPCVTPLTTNDPFCSSPDEFLFWDGIHPTRAGHAITAEAALESLNGP